MKKKAIGIVILAIICKVIGYFKEAILAYFFGASVVVDAYGISDSIVFVLCGWIVSLATVFIPRYIKIQENGGKEAANKYTNYIVTIAIVLSLFFASFLCLFSKQVVSIFASNSTSELSYYIELFFKIGIFSMVFLAVYRIARGYSDSNNHFMAGALIDTLISLLMMIVIVIAGLSNRKLIGFTSVFSYGIAAIVYLIALRRIGYKYKPEIRISDEIKSSFKALLPVYFNTVLLEITTLTDKIFAVPLEEGSIASLGYATLIENMIVHIFGMTIITITYPTISRTIVDRNKNEHQNVLKKAINYIVILFIPIIAGATILSREIVSTLYERGNFGSDNTRVTAILFILYVMGALAYILRELMSRILCAQDKNRIILLGGGLTLVINIILDIVFVKLFLVYGLALATTISLILILPFYWKSIKKDVDIATIKNILKTSLKSIIATGVMSIVLLILQRQMPKYVGIRIVPILALMVFAGLVVYLIIMYLLKVPEVTEEVRTISNKVTRRK